MNEQNTTEKDKATNLATFSLKNFLTDEQELMQWRSEGLSSDVLVVENALAVLQVAYVSSVINKFKPRKLTMRK